MAQDILAWMMLFIVVLAGIWSWWIENGPCKDETKDHK